MAIAVLRRMPIRTSRLISISNPISNALGAGCDGNADSLPSPERSSRDWMPLPQGLGGICQSNVITVIRPSKYTHPMCSLMVGACFSSEATKEGGAPTVAVVEVYEKMVKSLEARTMPPNAWLWSLIGSCSNQDDIKLLFRMLQKLRIFRLSNLRIHDNFNCHLCMRVTEACARASALDYGLKALWKHNVYGLTPSIGSAHYLLSYAKEHNDAKLMVKVMRTMQMNSLPLQPGTADIVFSICYNTNRWDLISKYAKKFMKVGVKLHRNAFGIWMEFAAKIGDVQTLWNIEKERSKSMKGHTLATGFSCVKGHLLQRKTKKAATVIQLLYQNLPDHKKPGVADELQKLVSEWALEVVKRQKKEDRQALADSLKNDIPAMINYLTTLGLEVPVKLESPEMLNW